MTWTTLRVKHLASIRISNVDKLIKPNELPVRLINYNDVYHGDRIVPENELMPATATASQVQTFGVRPGDVLITKDSETADDIGVPAYVERSSPDMVCGYHLALLRPIPQKTIGRFLYWALRSKYVNYQLSIGSTGITRHGLKLDVISQTRIKLPSLSQQRTIANFLDRETTRIDALISKKHRLIRLVDERKKLLAEEHITALRWSEQSVPIKHLVHESDARYRSDLEPTMLSVSIHYGVVPRDSVSGKMSRSDNYFNYKVCRPGDIVINRMRAFQGGVGVVHYGGIVSPDYTVLRVGSRVSADYLHFVMRSSWFISEMTRRLRGIGSTDQGQVRTPRINFTDLGLIRIPVPPRESQNELALSLSHQEARLVRVVDLLAQQLDALAERRQALITGIVTGRLDISEVANRALRPEQKFESP